MADDGEFDRERHYSDAESLGYAARHVAKDRAGADVAVAGITTSGAVFRELISVAKANPIIGVVLAAVLVDVLSAAKVIRPQTTAFLFFCIGVAFDVSAAAGVVDIFAELLPWSQNGGAQANADLIKPVPTTIVENPPVAANASVPPGASMGPSSAATAGQVAGLLAAVE